MITNSPITVVVALRRCRRPVGGEPARRSVCGLGAFRVADAMRSIRRSRRVVEDRASSVAARWAVGVSVVRYAIEEIGQGVRRVPIPNPAEFAAGAGAVQ